MAKKVALEIDVKSETVGQAGKKVENATTELRRLKRELASGGLTGKEFEEASKRAGILQDRISDVSQRVKNLASDTRQLDAVVSAAQGMAGGFALAQGAAALFGSENEELQKTFVKLQATMTALTGLQQLANTLNKDSALSTLLFSRAQTTATGTTSGLIAGLTGLKAALIATGIGAFVIAIGVLVANYEKLKNLFKSNIDLLKEDISLQKERRDLISSEMETMNLQLENLKLQGKSLEHIRKQQIQNLDLQLEALEIEIKKTKEIKEQQVQNATNIGWWERGVALLKSQYSTTWGLNHIQGEIKSNLSEIEETTTKLKELENDRLRIQNKQLGIQNEVMSERKKLSDKLAAENKAEMDKSYASEYANLLRRAQLIGDSFTRELELMSLKHIKERTAAEAAGEDLILLAQVQNQEMEDFEAVHLQKIEDIRQAARDKEQAEREKALQDERKYAEDTIAAYQQIENAKIDIAQMGGIALQQIANKNKALAIAGLALEKGSAIANVIINTQREIAGYYAAAAARSALTAGTTTAFDQALAAKQTLFAKVRAGAAIAAIGATGINSGRNLGGGAQGIDGGGGGSSAQQFQPPSLQQNTQGIRLQDNRVYVLESDISTTQRRVRTLESRSVVD